jgi:hypothetical protein
MSRFSLICSLVLGLSSAALVSPAAAQFAKAPPPAAGMPAPMIPDSVPPPHEQVPSDVPVAQMRIAPRAVDRAVVRKALARARAKNLASFRAYQAKGVFPSNTFSDGKLNVWRDGENHFCAAATMIKMSGQDELVNKVADENNFIRLADVQQGPLMDWILTSGFTQDEIAMIQEPFIGVGGEEMPGGPVLVDKNLRKAEDKRLRAKYTSVTRKLVASARKNLDKATDRLMNNPNLAWQLVYSQPG